ncbi:DUF4129 domain-containing protein [Allonocardiopsis opalescens]|uniref:Uncharacterized protein DUF4129 n=1 Tax=Allonocardiopsis opalescens TaxID=1144618 RepID=A0A2T0QC36_9ACTN|nr:DUF4129 domain-containing protein [Allonocardiopsis opalescens]PRY01514.1 uncharacterized protein DUF4129 [Allonocardiopsis opalescens]
MTASVAGLPDLGADEAAGLAREELSDPLYRRDEPSLVEWLWERGRDFLSDLAGRVGDALPGGWLTLVGVLAVVLAVGVFVFFYVGPAQRRARLARASVDPVSTPADHRARAERLAAAGRHGEALRERMRAIAADLEERTVVDPRPGRTAHELAAAAAAALPEHADALAAAARLFDDVWYGGRTAGPGDYRSVADLDERLRRSRPAEVAR